MGLSSDLLDQLYRLSCLPNLLVISDYDGTLVPFHDNPALVNLGDSVQTLIRNLSALAETKVVILSGRALSDLKGRFDQANQVICIGSHGWELETLEFFESSLTPLLSLVKVSMQSATEELRGSLIEQKPGSLVFHYRASSKLEAVPIVARLKEKLSSLASGILLEGKNVLEFMEHRSNKGTAIEKLIEKYKPDGIIFMGDDFTDEAGFSVLKHPALTIKVGSEETLAQYRIENETQTEEVLNILLQYRSNYINSKGVE